MPRPRSLRQSARRPNKPPPRTPIAAAKKPEPRSLLRQGYGRKPQLSRSEGRRADQQQAWTRQDRPAQLPSDPVQPSRRAATHRSPTLEHRKCSALDARRRSRRGSGAEPKGPCSRQPRRSATTCGQPARFCKVWTAVSVAGLRRHANKAKLIRTKIEQYATNPASQARNVKALVGIEQKR